MLRKRTAGRMLAFQALYQHELRGEAFMAGAEEFFRTSAKNPFDAETAELLFRGCLQYRDELDARIAEVSEHWHVTRMAAVDRAIMRIGAYELLHCPEVPPKVAIDEAIRLAKKYSAAESGAFVNGILDKIMKSSATQKQSDPVEAQDINHE